MKQDVELVFLHSLSCTTSHTNFGWSRRDGESECVSSNTDTTGSQNDAYSFINYTSICKRREDLSLGKRHGERVGRGALQSPNDWVPAGVWTSLCAQRSARWDSPGPAPVMWRGIREMNVFRISNNQRIMNTPSAFKSMDPLRLRRHFD